MSKMRLFTAALAGATLSACGAASALGLKKAKHHTADSAADAAAASAGDATNAAAQTFQFTADYKLRPVDVVVIRDGSSRDGTINSRLNAALPLLSARLWNLGAAVGSVHVAVFDQDYHDQNPDDDQVPPYPAAAIVDDQFKDVKVMTSEGMAAGDFDDALAARVGLAGGRGGSARPATVLLDVLAESGKEGGGETGGILRPDAFWAVLMIGATINPDDPYDVQDVTEALKGHTAGYALSALTLEKTSCAFAGVTPARETNPNKLPQRNLELKLAAATGGITGSVCPKTYTLFMDDFVLQGTGTQYFPVQLQAPVKADSIKITAQGDTPVKEYRYVPGSTTLEVSTLISSGQAFTVEAVVDGPAVVPIVSSDDGDAGVPQAGDGDLPPEQAAFVKNVQPALLRACGGCHSGRPFNTSGGYASAQANKGEIARRLQLPASDPQKMPQAGAPISDADKAAILGWAAQ